MKKLIFLFLISLFTQLSATNIQYTDKNRYKAFNLLHKAALKGHTLSQYELGLMFHYGQGVRQNFELARLWFTRAAKRGNPKAQDVLYRFYSAKKPKYFKTSPLRFSRNFRQYR